MKGFTVLLLMTVAISSSSQIRQVVRYEREHKFSADPFILISMREKGVALITDTDKFREGQRLYNVVLLDTALNESGTTEVTVPGRFELVGYDFIDDELYFLFREGETDAGSLHLVELSLSTRQTQSFDIKQEFLFKLTHFSMVNKSAVIGGYVTREPAVLIFDTTKKQMKVVPGFFTSDTELLDLRVNQNQTFNTLVTNRVSREKKKLVLRTFDHTGLQLMEDEIEIDENKTIVGALTSTLIRDELLIVGTYAAGVSRQASGFFSVLADPFKEQPIRYYDFGQLRHFLDYLNPKRAEKIKSSSKRNRDHGRDPEFRAHVANVRLDERLDGFYLLSEAYAIAASTGPNPYQNNFPYSSPYGYRTYSPYSSRYYNSPYTYNGFNNPSQGTDVNMLSSAVIAFDAEGKMDWDHSLKLKDGHRPALEQFSDFWSDRDKIVIANKNEEELMLRLRYKNDESASDTLKILTKNPTDIVRDDAREDGGVRQWYGNKFYIWGYQTVRDHSAQSEDRVRSVFYLVKVDAY